MVEWRSMIEPADGTVLAVDVGATKLECALVTTAGEVLVSERAATPPGGAADDFWQVVVGLHDAVLGAAVASGYPMPVAVGTGSGGPMSAGGELISPLNIPALRDFPLRDRLGELVGVPSFLDNDAKALALGEGWRGAAVGHRNYLAMVVSSGVGAGLVVDNRLLDGETSNAGHLGHVIVVPDGRRCACGARGCLEAEASGMSIAAITGRPAAEAGPDVIERTGRLVGRAVASAANLLDLRLALVAGSVALGFGDPFFAAAQAEIDRCSQLDFSKGMVIRRGGLGDRGPIIGAAAVALRGLGVDPLVAGAV